MSLSVAFFKLPVHIVVIKSTPLNLLNASICIEHTNDMRRHANLFKFSGINPTNARIIPSKTMITCLQCTIFMYLCFFSNILTRVVPKMNAIIGIT